MARLLIVHHTVSPSTHALLDAALTGARDPRIEGTEVSVRAALEASPADALAADGYLFMTPANLGYMSGALKHFFDQIYYPCIESTRKRPYGLVVHGDSDASGAVRGVEVITTGLGWRLTHPVLVLSGKPTAADLAAATETAAVLSAAAAGLI